MTTEPKDEDIDNSQQEDEIAFGQICLIRPGERLREGMICPRCHAAKMTYDGMLNLVCPNCGLTETGACT